MHKPVMLTALGLVAVLLTLPGSAQRQQEKDVLVSGYGVGARNSCAAFVREADEQDVGKSMQYRGKDYYPSHRLYLEWLSGFLTAESLLLQDPSVAAGHDSNDLLSWMRQYCRDKPLDTVMTAALKLIDHLKSQK